MAAASAGNAVSGLNLEPTDTYTDERKHLIEAVSQDLLEVAAKLGVLKTAMSKLVTTAGAIDDCSEPWHAFATSESARTASAAAATRS
eukprot:m.60236 g.60236  ORF g.60236 m.60236 type:complete len:88 (+) comp7943_c0_seq5:54-317(+)